MAQPAGVGNSINQDLGAKVRAVTSLLPAVVTTTATGTGVDLKGYESAVVLFHIGNSADTLSGSVYLTPSLEDSPDNTNWTAIPASGYREDVGTLAVIDAPSEDSKVIQVTVLAGLGRARYVRPLITLTGTHSTGIPVSAVVVKGHPRVAPATA